MLKSLETRMDTGDTYDETFIPMVAKGKRHRKRRKEMSLRDKKDSNEGMKSYDIKYQSIIDYSIK